MNIFGWQAIADSVLQSKGYYLWKRVELANNVPVTYWQLTTENKAHEGERGYMSLDILLKSKGLL